MAKDSVPDSNRSWQWRLGLALWIAGMLGVLAMVFLSLPVIIAQHPPHHPLKVPMWVISLSVGVQTGLFLAMFVWCGVVLAPRVRLRAPAFQALTSGEGFGSALAPQLLPGLIGGLVTATVPWYFISHGLIVEIHSPSALVTAVLYGGLTEEILMRWGLMTLLLWLAWRLTGRSPSGPSPFMLWAAILVSAVLFGAGHLPSTHLLNGHLTASMVEAIVGGGTAFGIVTGYLYARWGLESAMLCHALSHLVAYAAYKIV